MAIITRESYGSLSSREGYRRQRRRDHVLVWLIQDRCNRLQALAFGFDHHHQDDRWCSHPIYPYPNKGMEEAEQLATTEEQLEQARSKIRFVL